MRAQVLSRANSAMSLSATASSVHHALIHEADGLPAFSAALATALVLMVMAVSSS